MSAQITVLKFGSSVLRSEKDLPLAVHEIYRHWRRGAQVLAVVSALGATTDELLQRAHNICDEPDAAALATLLAIGEATAAALLTLHLHKAGVPAKVLNPAQVDLQTVGDALDAEPISINTEKLLAELKNAVVVVSGFVGVNTENEVTLLGRGGSDLTALFLAKELAADCILVKDVAGLYETDPAEDFIGDPRRYARANWQTALAVGGDLVQPKAIRFAQNNEFQFSISAPNIADATVICGEADKLPDVENKLKPLKIALLGCGTVGGGVYQRLAALPEFFEIVGVAERHREKALAAGVPHDLIFNNAADLIERDGDAVVELFGKIEPTDALVRYALQLDKNVVSANKALLAVAGVELEKLARSRNVKIRYSAAVGGALPALEIVSQPKFAHNLQSLAGILNGTCNFICDCLANGIEFGEAIKKAQAAGYAEADPTLDIDGTDAAQKLILLARAAFGANLPLSDIEREGIENLCSEKVFLAQQNNRAIRLIAECRRVGDGFVATVKPVEISASHPFAATRGVENCLRLETKNGIVEFIKGRGAGRWATAEAVIADLFDLWRASAHHKPAPSVAVAAAKFAATEVFV